MVLSDLPGLVPLLIFPAIILAAYIGDHVQGIRESKRYRANMIRIHGAGFFDKP